MLGLEDLGRAADGGASVAWAEERGGLTHMDAHTQAALLRGEAARITRKNFSRH